MSIKNNLPGIVLENYLNVVALEDGLTVSLSLNDCEYRFNGIGEWKSLSAGSSTQPIKAGQTLAFRATATPVADSGIGTFTISKKCELQGTCMSMLFGDNAVENTSLATKSYAFQKLFYNCTTIVKVSDGFLPATTLSGYCYDGTFQGCTSLIQGPSLPASTIAEYSYRNLFSGCTSLTNAPVANIKNLSSGTRHCQYVFRNCTNLVDASQFIIESTDSQNYAFYGLFNGCSYLEVAPRILINLSAEYVAAYMFRDCTRLKDVSSVQLIGSSYGNHACYYMFNQCAMLNNLPAMPIITETSDYCCSYMFEGCNSLLDASSVQINCNSIATRAFESMFQNCGNLVTLPSRIDAVSIRERGLYKMFSSCTNLVTPPSRIDAINVEKRGLAGMFSNCTNLVVGPDVLLDSCTTFGENALLEMFLNCSRLNHIRAIFKVPNSGITYNWLKNVSKTGTFVTKENRSWIGGTSGIPTGWTRVNES